MKIIRTYLSHKPNPSSIYWALGSIGTLILSSMLAWHYEFASGAAQAKAILVHGEYWRLWTALFLHADLKHLLSNALYLGGLAFLLHGYFGILGFPVLPLIAGGAINLLTVLGYAPEVNLVGASGVVYFMAAFWLTMYVYIERRLSIAMRFMNALGFTLVLLIPETFEPQVSYLAHALGYLCGIAAASFFFQLTRSRIRQFEQFEIPESEETPVECSGHCA